MATFQQLTDATIGVSAHAWSPDGNEVAFAPNSNELRIADAKTLETRHSLKEHDMLISAIDWHPTSNYIVTCAHDRNAFVWSFDEGEKKWKPSLVILRIERAALDCRWSRDGQKFAVASSAKCVPVCYYESDNNWWVSKMIKKHKSSVRSPRFMKVPSLPYDSSPGVMDVGGLFFDFDAPRRCCRWRGTPARRS